MMIKADRARTNRVRLIRRSSTDSIVCFSDIVRHIYSATKGTKCTKIFFCAFCAFVAVIHAGAEHLPNVPPRNTFLTRIVVDSLVNEDFHRKQAEARSLLK